MQFDHRKRLYLRSDYSALSFGYAALQPADEEESLATMDHEMKGGPCEFMSKNTKLKLGPVAFGSRKTRGNEARLHSHLGEGYAGDWAINKCRHLCGGMCFTWGTECFVILTYDGNNPALLRLQMRFMC